MNESSEESRAAAVTGATRVSSELSSFYADWYSDAKDQWEMTKRGLAAVDSVSHIRALVGERLGSVLDVGAGNGVVLERLSQQMMFDSACALEISPSGLSAIRGRGIKGLLRSETFDGYAIPVTDDEFDTAICIHVIEHVEHERQFIRELGRTAKRIFIEVPLEGGLRGRINRLHGHINYYTPPYFLNLLETSGMKPVAWRIVASSLAYEQHLYGSIKGLIRYMFRRSVLAIAGPNLAPHLTTYLLAVVCEKAA